MSLRLIMVDGALPGPVKSLMLDRLARVTAHGFGVQKPAWRGSDYESRLGEYASFTAVQAARCAEAGDPGEIEAARDRLRSGAAGLGGRMRRALGIRGGDEALQALRSLYGRIGIDMDKTSDCGPVKVTRCFFAQYYTPDVCRVVEALDQGLVQGLFGGWSLEFTERLTEGAPCCQAVLRPPPRVGESGS